MQLLNRSSARKRVTDVFGLSPTVLVDSYVDRGALDEELRLQLDRPTHIALRGVSKSGKSWLRQAVIPDSLTVQCRLGKTVLDLYREALGQLGIRLELSTTHSTGLAGKVEADGEAGIALILKVKGGIGAEYTNADATTTAPVSQDVDDLRLVADIFKASGKRLVVEDFHYLSIEERKRFAFDLKALWDFGVFVVIVGVWNQQNMLLYLNPDLTGRVHEVSIAWTREDLSRIFERGGSALNLQFGGELQDQAINDCYENAGILQKLIIGTLDRLGIQQASAKRVEVNDLAALQEAAMFYADQLNPLYQEFAARVSRGIRVRKNSTGIYAHAMAVVLQTSDEDLVRGMSLDHIFEVANAREPRIQKGNLKTVLEKIESLQVDEDGRGLVLAYNDSSGNVTIVDRQLLLYRRYATVKWPWEQLIKEAEDLGGLFDADN